MPRRRLPLFEGTGAITTPRRSRRRRPVIRMLIATLLGMAAIGVPASIHTPPRLVWNASASAPRGLYWVAPDAIARGDLVLAELPPVARRLAAERGYLPLGVPLVKRVAALGGDVVCSVRKTVSINHRALPSWRGCRKLAADEVFLLVPAVADSFDGRYFGPIKDSAVTGKLVPLWTW
jgi:conjugative transfer signal peptidase TraF